MKTWLLLSLLVTSVLPVSRAGESQQRKGDILYTVSELPTASGADFLQPTRINNRGDVLGKLDFSTGPFLDVPHVGLYSQGTTIDLHLLVPGIETNRWTLPIDLNDRGQAVFYSGGVFDHSFLYTDGNLVYLNNVFGRDDFVVMGMNNSGHLVGATITNHDAGEAFLYADWHFQLLGLFPGQPRSSATAINDRNFIIGWAGDGDGAEVEHTVRFRCSGVVDLRIDGYALAINNHGDILGTTYLRRRGGKVIQLPFAPSGFNSRADVVGSSIVNNSDSRAMLFVRGQARDLNDFIDPASGWRLIYAYDINDHGQIVGWGRINDVRWGGFILTPNDKQPFGR